MPLLHRDSSDLGNEPERDQALAAKRKAERDLDGLLEIARAGGSATALAAAINETQAKLEAAMDALTAGSRTRASVGRDAVEAMIRETGQLVLDASTPDERKPMFAVIGLILRYQPEERMVYGQRDPYLPSSSSVRVEGGTCTFTPRAFRPGRYSAAA